MDKLLKLHINRFRGVQDLSLLDLGDINVIVGDNNTGKTSILESLMLWQNPRSIETMVRNSRVRMPVMYARDGWDSFDCFIHAFPFSDGEDKTISLEIVDNNESQMLTVAGVLGKKMTDKQLFSVAVRNKEEQPLHEISFLNGAITYSTQVAGGRRWEITTTDFSVDAYSARMVLREQAVNTITYLSPTSHISGRVNSRHKVFGAKMKSDVISLLQLFDTDIIDYYLEPSESGMQPVEMIQHKLMGAVPLYTFGDGLRKVCYLAAQVVASARGILLIDELETSIHISVLPQIIIWLAQACQLHDVQVFATTHSGEAISALATAGAGSGANVVCYRLEKDAGKTFARRYSEDRLNDLVNRGGMDVR